MGTVAALAPGILQSRNHIVPFEPIQNDLANHLNAIIAANTAGNRQALRDLTDALYPTQPAPDYATMVARRTALLASINAGTVANYNAESRALLSALNSSPDNVRVGSRLSNWSIGENLDADFNAGTTAFGGGLVQTNAGNVVQPAQNVLTLTVASNDVVYNYQVRTGQPLSFVLGLLIPNRQLSSGTAPTAGGGIAVGLPPVNPALPVLVTDPAGVGLPFWYA